MKRILLSLLALALCAAAFPLLFASAQDSEPRRPVARPEKSLNQLVRRHERLKLDAAATARRVRAGGGLLLATPERRFELELTPNDLRAPDYRAEATDKYGVRRQLFERAPVRTYKGSVRGQAKALARFTLDDETIEGMILTPEERYYVEPLSKYEPEAAAGDFVLYKKSDIIDDAEQTCGTMDGEIGEALKGVSTQLAATTPEPSAVAGMMYETEIATEADYPYFTKLGASTAAVNAEIMSTMNQVDGVYEAELNISLKVVYQHVWTGTPTDTYPYGVADGTKLIDRFANYWNANFSGVHRDLAHLWTGQNLVDPFNDPNLIGIANPGTVCGNPQYAYAVSERLTTAANRALLAAHEIGHNFGATHGCAGTIMNSFLSGTKLTFCPASQSQIAAFLDLNYSCLTQSCSPVFSPAALSFPAAGGVGSVSVTTGAACAWTAKSNAPWIVINSGASGSGNKTVGYTVAANPDPSTRTGTLTIAGKTHTVTQGPATVIKSLTLTPANVAGGKKITGTVYLTQAAPAEGAVVTLSDNLAATTVPTSVVIPAGGKAKAFTITTVVTTTVQNGTVTASYNGSAMAAALTVRPAILTSLTLTAGTVLEGNSVTGKLTLDGAAPPAGAVVTLSDTLASADTPASVTIPSGVSAKTFVIPTRAASATQTGVVKALYAGVTKSAPLTIRPIEVAGLILTPEEVVGGNAAQGLVILETTTPKNISVSLAENVASVSGPASVVVPAGSRSAAFTLTTTAVTGRQTGVLTAAAQGSSRSRSLVVNRPPVLCSALSFAAPKTLSVYGSTPAMLTADLNGDGKLDLATVNYPGVSIYPGSGSGGFGAPAALTVANTRGDLAVGDFNLDGKNDLAVASGSTGLAVLLADANGSFSAPTYYSFGSNSERSIVVGDFNGDGRPDVATTNAGTTANLSVMLGDGRGGFGKLPPYTAGPHYPTDLAAGDFNGDGKSDLVVGTSRTTTAYVMLGSATGLSATPLPVELNNTTVPSFEPQEVAAGDFNKDGKQDLAFTYLSTTAVVLSDGKGGFGAPAVYKGPGYDYELLVKDMNGDGNEDLITLNNPLSVSVLLGSGAGGFTTPFNTGTPGWGPDVVAGDFNGDGRPDLAYTVNSLSQMAVQLSTCQ